MGAVNERSGSSPIPGREIEILPLPFRLTLHERMKAAMGLPAWIQRRHRLEGRFKSLRKDLARAYRTSSPLAWPEVAASWNLEKVNREISSYNKYFPIERDLPMDPQVLGYVEGGEAWKAMPLVDTDWILSEFPASLAGPPSSEERVQGVPS